MWGGVHSGQKALLPQLFGKTMEDGGEKKRAVTSAVPGMAVSTMRKLLARQRSRLATQTELDPFCLGEELAPGVTSWSFSVQVAVGLHQKRTSSRARDKHRPEDEGDKGGKGGTGDREGKDDM